MVTRDPKAASQAFDKELRAFEGEAGRPVVPGELRSWCLTLKERLAALIEAWKELDRGKKLEEILKADLELAHRVQALQERGKELSERLHGFGAQLDHFLASEAEDPHDSWEPVGAANKLREDLLAWIVHCRAHGNEIETWMIEAAQRDRGAGD